MDKIFFKESTKIISKTPLPLPESLIIDSCFYEFINNTVQSEKSSDKNTLEKQIFTYFFLNLNYYNDLLNLQSLNSGKTVCGKILSINDRGFKCLDCGIDRSSIICEACFINSEHKGHRTILQNYCSGCCDCGDKEAWKIEGFCKDHKGFDNFIIEIKIEEDLKNRIKTIINYLFFALFWSCDIIGKPPLQFLTHILESIILFKKEYLGLNLLIHQILKDDFIFSHLTLIKEKYSLLTYIFIYNTKFTDDEQSFLADFFITLFGVYEFKQELIKTYCDNFNFLFDDQNILNYNSNLLHLQVQIFTSQDLASYAIQSDHFINIIIRLKEELSMFITNQSLMKKNSIYKIISHLSDFSKKEKSCISFCNKLMINSDFMDKFCDIINTIHFKFSFKPLSHHIENNTYISKHESLVNYELQILDIVQNLLKYGNKEFLNAIIICLINKIKLWNKIYKSNDNISFYITLHRALSLCLSIKLLYKIDENDKNIDIFSGLFENFDDELIFIQTGIEIVLRSFSFYREIQRNYWILYGEEMKFFSQVYSQSKYGLMNLDLFLLQLFFSSKTIDKFEFNKFQSPLIQSIESIINNDKIDVKTLDYFSDFLNLIYNIGVNELIFINKISFFSRGNLIEKYKENEICRIIKNFLFQYNSVDFLTITKILFKKFINIDYCKQEWIEKIVNFDTNRKQFITSNIKDIDDYDCFSFCFDPSLSSEYHDNILNKFKKNEEFDFILGPNKNIDIKQKNCYINIINISFVKIIDKYLELFMSIIINNEKYVKNFHIIKMAIKIINHYIFLLDTNEEFNNRNLKEIAEKISNFSFINSIDSLGEKSDLFPNIKLTTKNFKTNLMNFNSKFSKITIDTNNIKKEETLILELKKTISKEEMKMRQNELKKQFELKQFSFKEKSENQIFLNQENIEEKDKICVSCKIPIDEKSIYGFCCYISESNTLKYSYFQRLMNLLINEKDQIISNEFLKISKIDCNYWNYLKENLTISSCKHLIHESCYHNFKKRNSFMPRFSDLEFIEFSCPLCSRLCNLFISFDSKIENGNNIIDLKTFETIEIIDIKSNQMEIEKEEIKQPEIMQKKTLKDLIPEYSGYLKEKILNMYFKKTGKNENLNHKKQEDFFTKIISVHMAYHKDNKNETFKNDFSLKLMESCFSYSIFKGCNSDFENYIKNNFLLYKIIYQKYVDYLIIDSVNVKNLVYERKKTNLELLEIMLQIGEINQNLELFSSNKLLLNDLGLLYCDIVFKILIYLKSDKELLKSIKNYFEIILIARIMQFYIIKNNSIKYDENFILKLLNEKELINSLLFFFRLHYCIIKMVFNIKEDYESSMFLSEREEIDYISNLFDANIFNNNNNNDIQNFNTYSNIIINWLSKINHENDIAIIKMQTTFLLDINLVKLDHKFGDFSKIYLHKKCEICDNYPSQGELCLCLICGISICSEICGKLLKGPLNNHSSEFHSGSSVFLGIFSGLIYWIKFPRNYLDKSLYSDKMGLSFHVSRKNWNDFCLDIKMFEKIQKSIRENSIGIEIEYLEKTHAKKHYDNFY